MKWAIYRDYGYGWQFHSQPVRRDGKTLTFKTKKLAKQWVKQQLKKGVKPSKDPDCKWRVDKLIKPVNNNE